MAASTSTGSNFGEPFQLYLGSTLAQKPDKEHQAVYATYNPDFPGHATVTAQRDGIHVWDLRNLHAVASYSVSKHVVFSTPALSLCVTDGGSKSVVSYVAIHSAPDIPLPHRGRIVWVIRQSLSSSGVATREKAVVVVHQSPVQICATGHDAVPLLLVFKDGSLSLANAQVGIKSQLNWPGEREHVKTFLFPRKSCSFIQDDTDPCSKVAVVCCRTSMTLHIPITSSVTKSDTVIHGVTCSPAGVFSFFDSGGMWEAYHLISLNSTLVSTSVSEKLHLPRFQSPKNKKSTGVSVISLGTSLVLLAARVKGVQDIYLQIWDMSYGVLLTVQSIPLPSGLQSVHLSLTVADEGQALLTVSPSRTHGKKEDPKRSSIHIIPMDTGLESNLAAVLGKSTLTAEWLAPIRGQKLKEDDDSIKIISDIRASLRRNHAQYAEQEFLNWVNSHDSKEAVLGHEFVKKILNIVLHPESLTNYPYTPRIIRCLLENAAVSTIMFNGRLITTLRERGDWENVMFALTTVGDVSEDELMGSAKFLIDRQRKSENRMDVGGQEGYVPPLWSYLLACVSYPFTAAPMCLAIRKHLSNAQDLVMILEILENWIRGGTEHEIEILLQLLATNTKTPPSMADSPPYPKVVTFLQALLDASFVALLQYQPAHDLLRRILSYIEPEISCIESLERLRGVLEPFAKVQLLKEKTSTSRESPAEWRRQKKQLEQRAALNIGLYRLEELAI